MTRSMETHYLDDEGRDVMRQCLRLSMEACVAAGLTKLVIFTGTGDGPQYAAQELLSQKVFRNIDVVAVTPPVGRPYRVRPGDETSDMVPAGIHPVIRDDLEAMGIQIISAHLPFQPTFVGAERSSEWSRVVHAYDVLGGGFAYCIQAVLVACDAGAIQATERVAVASADTSFITTACRTESFLSPFDGLLVEHIICRPMRYGITKREHRLQDYTWGRSPGTEVIDAELVDAASPAPAVLASGEPDDPTGEDPSGSE